MIKIRKGHDIRIAGIPKMEILTGISIPEVALKPVEYRYVKPKLLVQEGDAVKLGTPLFFNKKNHDQKWGSPGAGTVKKIQYGPRRVIENIVIALEKDEQSIPIKSYKTNDINSLKRTKIKSLISDTNLWHLFRQRPFNCVANPNDEPRDIFISALNTAPLSPDINLVLGDQKNAFQAGVNILNGLTDGKVHIGISADSTSETLAGLENCELHRISGPHPAGNVGIQIHHIAALKPSEVVWTINSQHVIMLGKLFLIGKIDPTMIVSVGGPSVKNPIHIKTRLGAKLGSLLDNQLDDSPNRVISGDVLTGTTAGLDEYLGFYDTTVSVIPEDHSRPFLGWLHPGSSKKSYSLSRSFIIFAKKPFNFSTKQNGSQRAIVPIDAWEDALPMDILPNPLYRAILANDIEEMEQLGILECDDEDFALCSFACPSKIDVGAVIRKGLDQVMAEL